jgi:phosphatidylserine/phosphatidylglycerophosphate/cardiolipin synthase-like enzyme
VAGGLTLHVGPTELGGPDDLEAAIVDFIDGARKQLLVAVQELESRPIAEAILRAAVRLRAVRGQVRVILEGDYLSEEEPAADPWVAGGGNERNREIHGALLRARVPVITDLNPKIFHQKFIVRDADGSAAAVLGGSTNFTPTCTHQNLNHVVVMPGKRVAGIYEREFEELWTGTFGEMRVRDGDRPEEFRIGKVRVKPLFAPDHAPEMEVMKQMLKAKQRIDFAIFTFTDSSGIDDTMKVLQRSQIPVRGVLDRGQGNRTWAATKGLNQGSVDVYLTKTGTGVRKLHHKLMVIDDQLLIVGSFNYTEPATLLNDENLVVIGDVEETDAQAVAEQKRLAQYARAEIDRIIADLSDPV